jgi:hypothetical protein
MVEVEIRDTSLITTFWMRLAVVLNRLVFK